MIIQIVHIFKFKMIITDKKQILWLFMKINKMKVKSFKSVKWVKNYWNIGQAWHALLFDVTLNACTYRKHHEGSAPI